MTYIDRLLIIINKFLMYLGGVFLVAMILLTSANIFMRILKLPISGTFELMGYFGAVATAFSLANTENLKGHIAVDILINAFSEKTQLFLKSLNNLILGFLFVFATNNLFIKTKTLQMSGELTETLRIIYYPFTFMVAIGCLALTLTFFLNFIKSISQLFRSQS